MSLLWRAVLYSLENTCGVSICWFDQSVHFNLCAAALSRLSQLREGSTQLLPPWPNTFFDLYLLNHWRERSLRRPLRRSCITDWRQTCHKYISLCSHVAHMSQHRLEVRKSPAHQLFLFCIFQAWWFIFVSQHSTKLILRWENVSFLTWRELPHSQACGLLKDTRYWCEGPGVGHVLRLVQDRETKCVHCVAFT